jgi:hypothetical protein
VFFSFEIDIRFSIGNFKTRPQYPSQVHYCQTARSHLFWRAQESLSAGHHFPEVGGQIVPDSRWNNAGLSGINRSQIAIGVTSLLTGLFVYLTARASGTVWFLRSMPRPGFSVPHVVAHAAGPLPTLTHSLGFSLLSAGLVGSRQRGAAIICAAWFLLESAFEIGQRSDISAWLTPRLPAWFDHVWLLANARSYFTLGTFDLFDLAACAAGAALAYFIVCLTQPEEVTP